MMTSTNVNNHENSIVWNPGPFHLSWGFQKMPSDIQSSDLVKINDDVHKS